jgi:hypothetical protein
MLMKNCPEKWGMLVKISGQKWGMGLKNDSDFEF